MNERDIFIAALQKEDAAERRSYLDAACGPDTALRQRVEGLLQLHEQAGSFLESPPMGATLEQPVHEGPGTVIGPYKLLEQIGEGGMGTVWMAQQTEPVKRLVAVKLIKAGMDSKAVIARFEAERQALALMDHPNIAKVLDAGTTGERRDVSPPVDRRADAAPLTGRPYFVMDLVKGVPITKYCDDHHLTPRQRLELFIPVCQAVQHAHQKGIIHRDLKPSNVLVALYDGKPVPKVIDFGVAKAAGQPLTEKTLVTGFGNIVGTLEYMSPEQAEINQLDIDTRSDIYSLGVLLYELLTGSPPFSRQELTQAGMLEMLRVIREQEPSKPSTKLSTAEGLPTLAANRGTEPAKLTKLVRGELDWIVMKALEKDRSRRYETANGFAMDVQRYLADETVQACPPSAGYRLRKFARRYRKVLVTAAAFVLLLILGVVISTWQAIRATNAGVTAQQAEKKAAEEAAIAKAVNDFLQQDLLRQADSRVQADGGFVADPNLTVKEALQRAAARIGDRFQDQPLVEAAIRQAIGEACVGIGAGGGLGELGLGMRQLERAVALRKAELGPEHPLTLSSMKSLASAYVWVGRSADALVLLEPVVKLRKANLGLDHADTLESMRELGAAYRNLLRLPEAIAVHEETVERARASLGPDHTLTLDCMSDLAWDYGFADRAPDAVALWEETLRLRQAKWGPHHPSTLINMMTVGSGYMAARRSEEAIEMLETTLKLMKEKMAPGNPNADLGLTHLIASYRLAGKLDRAEARARELLEARRRRVGPESTAVARALATLGGILLQQQKYAEAEPLARAGVAIWEKKDPDAWETFGSKSLFGACLLGLRKYAEAEPQLLQAYQGLKERESRIPIGGRQSPIRTLEDLVQLYEAMGKKDEAARWRKELEARTKAAETAAPPKAK
jgi:serine/threonine protein kinase